MRDPYEFTMNNLCRWSSSRRRAGERAFDIYSRLSQGRIIFLSGRHDAVSA